MLIIRLLKMTENERRLTLFSYYKQTAHLRVCYLTKMTSNPTCPAWSPN